MQAMNNFKLSILFFLLFCFFSTPIFAESLDSSDDTENSSKDSSQVYHVFGDVYLLSALKYSYGKPKIVVKSVYPQLQSDTDSEGVNNFNQLVLEIVQQEIDGFANYIVQSVGGKKIGKNDLYIDYATSVIQSGYRHIVSIRFAIQGFVAGVKNAYHYHRVLNYDLENNRVIELQDLFDADTNYLDILSNYTQNVLLRRLGDKPSINEMTAATETNFKNWNVKPNGLLITFDEYQGGIYSESAQTVLVPYSVLRKFIPHESPLSGCVKSRWKCGRNNLLTGGFIDEAMKKTKSKNKYA